MDAAGQQLATFMNNVLNVARIEDDQFVIRMQEESWPAIIESAVSDMRLRAKIRVLKLKPILLRICRQSESTASVFTK